MINVCIAGVTGWTGKPVAAAIQHADDLNLTSGVSRSAAGQSLATAIGLEASGRVYSTVAEALDSARVDVLVDYTSGRRLRAGNNGAWLMPVAREPLLKYPASRAR